MTTRWKIIVIILILLILAGVGFIFWRSQQQVAKLPNYQVGQLPTSPTSTNPQLPNYPVTPLPSYDSASIRLGTPKGIVTVNNFRKLIISSDESIDVFKQTTDYALAYENYSQKFRIQLFTTPTGSTGQQSAEKDLMDILNISQSDACKLPIIITSINPNSSPVTNWSFCPPGV